MAGRTPITPDTLLAAGWTPRPELAGPGQLIYTRTFAPGYDGTVEVQFIPKFRRVYAAWHCCQWPVYTMEGLRLLLGVWAETVLLYRARPVPASMIGNEHPVFD